jgi:hypothetical protein
MLADLFLSVADAVTSYTIDKLDPAETLKTWLKREPAKLAFQKALARTYAAFARQYPEYAASLFDQSFLSKEAVPEISKLLIRSQHPDPALLAQAWGRSIGFEAHSEFCKRAIKPASDFLAWLEAELKAEQAFQALFDSRALDSLPRLEAEIEKLTKELTRGLDTALKIASEYERIALNVGGNIQDANIILGDGNQINVSNIYNTYYTGAFDRLNDFYVPPDSVFQRVRVDEFVGRDWLTAKVDAFLNETSRKSGAFLLIGEAGVGKTSFMAHLVKERRYLHLFAEQVAGDANLQRALQSLGSQLVTHYQIDPYKDRDTLTQLAVFPDFIERLLRLAASTLTHGEKIVIVCDALDEAGTFPDGNVFGLPNVLPDGVYFILSQRPVNTKLPNFEALRFNLEAQGADNLQDMQTYLSAVAKRPEVAGQIRSKEYSEAFFIQTLKEKSLGVWMYLHYIIKEIESGSRAPLDLENLPTGLTGYYADYWDDWRYGRRGRGKGEAAWNTLYSPLLTTLAAAQEAITVEQLIQWADVKASLREVAHLLNQSWRSFITEKETEKNRVYAPYHLSFRDFITGRVDFEKLDPKRESLVRDLAEQTVEAHARIVKAFEEECKGEWEKLVGQDYPRLHLSVHLAGAKEHKKLIDMLTEGTEHIHWAEARYKKEETYVNYLGDLAYVWGYAEQKDNYVLVVRCMLIENSIHSLASNISPQLLVQLAKIRLWSYPRCLSTIRENSDSSAQAESLELILPDLPPLLLPEALAAAREIKDESDRASALLALAPHLNDEQKAQALPEALAAVREIKDEDDRASALSALAPHLNDELKAQVLTEALAAAREIKEESSRAFALSDLAQHLNDELKAQVLPEALAAAREIRDENTCARALSDLAPHLNEELKAQVLPEALAAVREIKDEQWRASVLSDLAPHLNEELKAQVLAAVHEIKDEYARARALVNLAPHLNEELKAQVLTETLAAAREIKSEYARASVLSDLAPHLNEELQAQVLPEALAAAREIRDENTCARALSDLAPHLNEELQAQALAAAREIKSESTRARALSNLAPHLNEELKAQALAAVREIKSEYVRARAWADLAPHLNEELKTQLLPEALAAAREIKDESDRASVWADLAPHLNEDLKAQALAAAREIKSEYARAFALSALTPHLNEELKAQVLTEALAVAREIKDEVTRAFAVADLAPYLNDELKAQVLTEALAAAREIKSESARASALSALAPHLNDELKAQVLPEAFAAVREIKDEVNRAFALSALAPHLSEELKAQALAEAREIKDEYDRTRALSDLAPHLNEELQAQALAAAREINDEQWRARALSALAPHLNEELQAQALAAAREINDEQWRARALSALALHLNEELKAQTLAAVREIKGEYDRARALSDLAPHLNEELKAQTLAAAREIKNEDARADALMELAPHLGNSLQIIALIDLLYLRDDFSNSLGKAFDTWEEIEFRGLKENIIPFLNFMSQKDRKKGVEVVRLITPALIHFRGPDIVPELFRAVMDTARWWP